MTERLAALRRRLGDEPSDQLLNDLLLDAQTYILCFTAREDVPEALWPVQVQLAAITYRRLGAEGEQSHEEGGVRMQFDTDMRAVKEQLKRYRLGFVGMKEE